MGGGVVKSIPETTMEKFKKKHGDKYDYSKVEYANNGTGCPECSREKRGMARRLTTEEFCKRVQEKFGDKYDLSLVEYKNSQTPVTLVCPEHGEFNLLPGNLRKTKGCPQCTRDRLAEERRYTTEDFVEQCKVIVGDEYDFSKVEYKNAKTKVLIGCPEHGTHWMHPESVKRGCACPECSLEKRKYTQDDIIAKLKDKYGDQYTYNKVEYTGMFNDITLTCKEHGDFTNTPYLLLNTTGRGGCQRCSKRHRYTTEEFIDKLKTVFHNHDYDYSKTQYVNGVTKATVTCPIHGDFSRTPAELFRNKGCTACRRDVNRSTGEHWVFDALTKFKKRYKFTFEEQVRLIEDERLTFDFVLYDANDEIIAAIEYHGKQHTRPVNWSGTLEAEEVERNFESQVRRDVDKTLFCIESKIPLLIIFYDNSGVESLIKKFVSKELSCMKS